MVSLAGNQLLVLLQVDELRHLIRIGDVDLDHPAGSERLICTPLQIVRQLSVDLDNLT